VALIGSLSVKPMPVNAMAWPATATCVVGAVSTGGMSLAWAMVMPMSSVTVVPRRSVTLTSTASLPLTAVPIGAPV
jgi:hypothetical protein